MGVLELRVGGHECFDEVTGEFKIVDSQVIKLEHSLISLSKWESKWKKPFLAETQKTEEEIFDYMRCMSLTPISDELFEKFTIDDLAAVSAYIEDPMSATTITRHGRRSKPGGKREQVTSELIYYWMIACDIPFTCEKWNLNRLMKLIDICNVKNGPEQKMSKKEAMAEQRALNAARRAKTGSSG